MRIRRRPQAFSFQLPDRSPNASRNQEWLGEGREEGRLHPNVDLGGQSAAPLPQDNVVGCSRSMGAQEGDADSHRSLENGQHNSDYKSSMTCTGIAKKPELSAEDEELSNGGVAAPAPPENVTLKDERSDGNGKGGGARKRRSPGVLMEGSRCSRVNGRGWRCSQPTLVGYSLCEHHLGKGRIRSVSGGSGGAGQLGRTEPRNPGAVADAVAVAAVVTAEPKAEEPSGRHC